MNMFRKITLLPAAAIVLACIAASIDAQDRRGGSKVNDKAPQRTSAPVAHQGRLTARTPGRTGDRLQQGRNVAFTQEAPASVTFTWKELHVGPCTQIDGATLTLYADGI